MPILTLKQITDHLLDHTYVRGELRDVPADRVFFGLLATYAPDVRVEMYWPEQFKNPPVSVTYGTLGVPLRRALADLCAFCGVVFSVTDAGALAIAPPARRVDAMRHAVVIEVPEKLSEWTPVASVQKEMSPRANRE